ncbi:DNA methyltransferase [Novosphingobium sp. KA1]|uniref:DNA methyltransferase n=1 Tax=Novosphingobium sp. (strain KA1) TaxID=164608 RepID=UPI001A8D1DF9|nr:DNA methyltransferase [Novosphingobium sp. KA1]
MMQQDYRAFLEAKAPLAQPAGLPCALDDVPTHLKTGEKIRPHQRAIIRWAVEGGRRALFEAFGLGKSIQQLLILDIVLDKLEAARRGADGPAVPIMGLIVAPLGVRREFIADAKKLGIPLHFVKSDAEIDEIGDSCGLYLTNYESVRDGKIDVSRFTAVSLDEASVLRSYGSKTFQEFLPLFEAVPYRFVATATPSPNRYKELIHYAGFLGIMDTGQALTRFFQRNSEKANDLNLYPHKEDEFWLWVNSWSVFLQRPSDLGFSDDGYDLPEMIVRWHEVKTDISGGGETDNFGQAALFRDKAVGVVGASREKRRTLDARIAKVGEIMAEDPADHYLLWHDLEDERRALEKLDGVEAVYGAQDLDDREEIVRRFADGELSRLAAKPVMLGSGANLQRHCHRAIFAGVGFKFNDFIQAIHRIYRFLQSGQVVIDIIYAETEDAVRRELLAKWQRDEEMKARMSEIIRKYGLNHAAAADAMKRSIGVERTETTGAGWTLAHNDCVEEARLLEEGSLDLIVTSIPFSNHYEYTPSYNDFGHTDDDAHFFAQMDFLTPELLRALAPGRLACVHVKDRILFGNVTGEGVPTVNPFHADCIMHYRRHGFQYMGMIHVNTDVVRENNQTYRLSYSEMLKDGTKMGVGSPEYVLLMRKPQSDRSRGYADRPVRKSAEDYSLAKWQIDAHAFWRSSGERLAMPPELAEAAEHFGEMGVGPLVKAFMQGTRGMIYDFDAHVAIGEHIEAREKNDTRGHLPRTFMSLAPGAHDPDTWDDVVRMRTLNAEQVAKGREKHVCPLQFDIVDRLIDRFSMEGDLVYDPFCGLGTVPMRALLKGRRGAGSELNPDYYAHSIRYLQEAEAQAAVPTLFGLLGLEDVA